MIQPNHIECVIVELDGELWKYSRYFDNPQFWNQLQPTNGKPRDVVLNVNSPLVPPPGEQAVMATERTKYETVPDEYEMYNVTRDPQELQNIAHHPEYSATRARLQMLLDEQRKAKRLTPISGEVPGQPT